MSESKSFAPAFGLGGTKRRRFNMAGVATAPASIAKLSNRVTRLSKKMRMNNPTHLAFFNLATTFSSLSTAGTQFDICSFIAQGDNYSDRVGSKVYCTRLFIKGTISAGSTAAANTPVRITILKSSSNAAFASNMTGTYSPISTGASEYVFFDKFISIPSAGATAGFPVNLNISVRPKHYQKFTGAGVGTTTGESIFVIMQSGAVAGTTAPTISSGVMELYFQPM